MTKNLKTMIGTLAVATAVSGFAQPVAAAEKISLSLEGYMEQWLGLASQNSDWETANGTKYAPLDQQSDTEVHFVGATKLDNGIEVSVTVELEGDESATEIDESYLSLESSLGLLQMGGVPNVLDQSHVAAPEVGIENQDGDYMNWILTPANFVDTDAVFFNIGKSNKINYYTPPLQGFQLAATYTPDAETNGQTMPDEQAGERSAYSGALLYGGELGDVSIDAILGFGKITSSPTATGQNFVQTGLNIGYMGFVLGGSYADIDEKNHVTTTSANGNVYDIGLSYSSGSYAISANWFHSEAEGEVAVSGTDKKDSVMLSGAYNLGPGVDLSGSLFYVDFDDETTAAVNNNDGVGGVAGLTLTF